MVGTCTECCNETGACNNCEEDFINNSSILCYREEHHFCNEDCLLSWLKNNSKLKESTFEIIGESTVEVAEE